MAKHSLDTVPIECDSLRSDVAQVLELAAERAQELEIVGGALFDSIAETARSHPSDELRNRAVRLQSGARHAAELASEIQRVAGRLEGLALARRIIEGEIDAGTSHSNSTRRS